MRGDRAAKRKSRKYGEAETDSRKKRIAQGLRRANVASGGQINEGGGRIEENMHRR